MPITITLRWAGPADASLLTRYRIERTLDGEAWTVLEAYHEATSPYNSYSSTLAGNTAYGSTTITVANAALFSNNGWLWIDDALVNYVDKSSNQLLGCIWHSGYGVYAAGTVAYLAHESYSDENLEVLNNAVLYRITQLDASDRCSAPAHIWYYDPPTPEDRGACVVIVNVGSDLGVTRQAGVTVQAYLSTDDHFAIGTGQHLDSNATPANSATTNPLGLAFFHCWKNSARAAVGGGADQPYLFVLRPGSGALTLSASVIPDRDWVLLSQIVDAQITE